MGFHNPELISVIRVFVEYLLHFRHCLGYINRDLLVNITKISGCTLLEMEGDRKQEKGIIGYVRQ